VSLELGEEERDTFLSLRNKNDRRHWTSQIDFCERGELKRESETRPKTHPSSMSNRVLDLNLLHDRSILESDLNGVSDGSLVGIQAK